MIESYWKKLAMIFEAESYSSNHGRLELNVERFISHLSTCICFALLLIHLLIGVNIFIDSSQAIICY